MDQLSFRPRHNPLPLLQQLLLLMQIFCMLALIAAPLLAQDDTRLELVELDASAFPIVRITLLTADPNSAPINDISRIVIRENGVPVTDVSATHAPVGADFIFVLDANDSFNLVDEGSTVSRREVVQASIQRFANAYMNQEGLDRVSVIVPDDGRQGGRFLIENATDPQAVSAAIGAYNPEAPGLTLLNAMMSQALEHAAAQAGEGRFQSILLFTDGGRLAQQLSYPLLAAQANDARTSVFGAILGARADENEINNVTRLTDPTRGQYVHLAQPEAADKIYHLWQEQSNPLQLQYRSMQRQSGRNQVNINLDQAQVEGSFEIALEAPEVLLASERILIRRVGTAHDTPLAALQPTVHPLTLQLNWPDDLPRRVTAVTLSANGQPLTPPTNLVLDAAGKLNYTWDVSQLPEGPVELEARVTDELGYQGSSNPLIINIEIARPAAPTPTITPEPETLARPTVDLIPADWQWLGALLLGLLIVLTGLWFLRRRRSRKRLAEEEAAKAAALAAARENRPKQADITAQLTPLNHDMPPIALSSDKLTFGRDAENVQIVLDDPGVSRLHARILRRGDTFWLYDEGSAEGTFHNFERLGLSPRPLQSGDTVQFGHLSFRFESDFSDPEITL